MIRRVLGGESGYSLVEVIVSVLLLTIAIIPMVSMFDAGLRAANVSSDNDRARALADRQIERAKSVSYAELQSNFPISGAAMSGGSYTSPSPIISTASPHEVSEGFSYIATKQYVEMSAGSAGQMDLVNASTDKGMIEVTVTANWDGNSYSITHVVGRDT